MIPMNLATVGERCPVEIATIIDRFNKYVKQLRIDPDNIVDLGLVKNLVDVEIQLARADRRCAITADIVEQVIAVVTERGEAYYRPEISKAAEYKLKLISEHGRILSLLNATRKDKAANKMNISIDASNYAAQLLRRKAMLESSIEAEVIRDDTE
jgi:predicted HNH restriction endonuclease